MPENSRDERELEVRREEIRAGAQRVVEVQRTIRFCFGVVGFVAIVGIVSYAVVQIVSQPPWLTLALALLGPSGFVSAIAGAYIRYLNGRVTRLQQQIGDVTTSSQIGEAK